MIVSLRQLGLHRETLAKKKKKKKKEQGQVPVAHTCNSSYREAKIRRIKVQGQPEQIVQETLSRKYPTQKRTGGMAQVVEYLTSVEP
jgi:hypothetical protein